MATGKPLPITGGPVRKPRPHRAYLNASEDRLSGPSALTTDGSGIWASFSKIAEAEAVQTNGFDVLLCCLM